MTDCNDGSDAPEGSLADLVEDLESVAQSFREEADSNVQDRAAGQPVYPGGGQVAQTSAMEFEEGTNRGAGVFDPRPLLLVQHDSDAAGRPLPRRPNGPPPLKSDAMTIKDGTGSETETLEAGAAYTVECKVRNVGGFPARDATVELFVEHRPLEATLDISRESDSLELYPLPGDEEMRERGQTEISGHTTMPPGSSVAVVMSPVTGDGNHFETRVHDYRIFPVTENRTFGWDTDFYAFGKRGDFYDTHDSDAFKMRVYPHPIPDRRPVDGVEKPILDRFMEQELWKAGVEYLPPPELENVDGTFVRNGTPSNDKRSLDLSTTLQTMESGPERVDRKYATVSPSDTESLSFSYTPDSKPYEDGGLTTFYLRTYDMGNGGGPDDWGRLDHTGSRFIGRTEAYWPLTWRPE